MTVKAITEEMVPAYSIISITDISELNTKAYYLKHKKTGAKVALMVNDDENKVFNIGFRTPPQNDAGLPHILEHSVLCGSKKYPAKNPFEELIQGSLNTFLNAMTFPDRTIYPVASCNDKDFKNLMDVYLDAVFHPSIYDREEIFKQEGWHYDLQSKDGEITYNGVVYNEMKGAFSDPESVLERYVNRALYPDNCYGYESGGDPERIPELSYEEFLDFHRKYYHPSNSYIYLYGNMDMEERLDYIDKEYLSAYDMLNIDSAVKYQKPFDKVKILEGTYPVGSDEDCTDKGFLSYAAVTGDSDDRELYYAFKVLNYALLSMPGAPVKQALIDAGIGKAVTGGSGDGILQNYFIINAKNTDVSKRDRFVSVIENTLKDIVKKGINKKSLKAALNVMEFQYREADFGSYPRGLYYCMYVMDSWNYNDDKPFIHVKAGDTFAKLNRLAETSYFEELIEKYILDNTHKVIYALKPEKGLEEKKSEKLCDKLKLYKDSLTEEQIEKLVEDTKVLEKYQSEPSPKEDIERIPVLEIKDIEKNPKPYNYKERNEDVKVIFSDVFSNGICYINASFDCKYVPKELIPYAGFLENILGRMDTEHYRYSDLNNEINIHSGGLSTNAVVYNMNSDNGDYNVRFDVNIKVFYKEIPFAFKIMEEILLHTNVENEKRLKEIIGENLTNIRSSIISSGHRTALYRGYSYVSSSGMVLDMINGIGAYEFFDRLDKNFDYREITENLKKTIRLIFNRKNIIIGCTCDEEGYKLMAKEIKTLADSLYTDELIKEGDRPEPEPKNEGIVIPSPVSYVARVGNFKKAGFKYTGTLLALRNALDYGYLWNNIRVKGGAYGVMSNYQAAGGNMGYMSYRDPNVSKTSEVFLSIPEYLKDFTADEREIRKYIIGAISSLDTPLNPRAEGSRSFTAYICGKTNDELKQERNDVLSLSREKIRETAPVVDEVLKQNYVCAVGNKEKINQAKDMFKEIREIFK
ncbi:MAG: insulinase family protein [Lachnospiraceae bacterium]